jgi:hypothetical protein
MLLLTSLVLRLPIKAYYLCFALPRLSSHLPRGKDFLTVLHIFWEVKSTGTGFRIVLVHIKLNINSKLKFKYLFIVRSTAT